MLYLRIAQIHYMPEQTKMRKVDTLDLIITLIAYIHWSMG